MGVFKRLYKNADFWPVALTLVIALLAGRMLLSPGYFNMHDDLQMMRQLEMEKCFLDFQIPCRWVPDMGYGFGFPLFNYYPPLPYLIGEIFRILGFSFVDTVKLTFLLSFLASGVGFYLLVKEFFGRLGGAIASIFYVWAPYHAVDIYVRGAMNEAWALVWFPVILWTSYRLIKDKKNLNKWVIGLALSYFALFTSHNLMVLIFTPVFAGWCLLFLWTRKAWKKIPQIAFAGILSFGLAAFFVLPAVLEQKYVQVNTLVIGYYEYIAHFANLNQLLISRFWGYGPSVWMEGDGMSFQVGHLHWVISIVILGLVLWRYLKTRKLNQELLVVIFMLALGWFSAFMAHLRSIFIWTALPFLKFVQFPWRFLALAILGFSFSIGAVFLFIKKRYLYPISFVLAAALIIFNWNYFRPEKIGPLTDEEKFSGAAWELQQTAGIYDYLPVAAKEAPKEPRKYLAEAVVGNARIIDPKSGTNWAEFAFEADAESEIRLNIFKFPNWRVFIDRKEIETFVPEDEKWGRMHLDVPAGSHNVYARLENTWPRTLGNTISLASWVGLFSYPFWKRKIRWLT